MAKRYFWIKQDERTGWEPALMDRFGHYWPIGDDGWVTEKDLLELGPELRPPVTYSGTDTVITIGRTP